MRRVVLGLCLICILVGFYLFTVFLKQQYCITPIGEFKKYFRHDPPPVEKKKDPEPPIVKEESGDRLFEDVDISEKGTVMPGLAKVLETDLIRIDDNWIGYRAERKANCILPKSGNAFSGQAIIHTDGLKGPHTSSKYVNIPVKSSKKFLKILSNTPLIERAYKPRITVTDSYPDTT